MIDPNDQKYMNHPLSNTDINHAIRQFESRGANIICDSDLHQNSDIEQIFNNRGHCIVFHKYPGQKCGHWFTLLRTPDKKVYMIDSFGRSPDYYSKNILKILKNNGIKDVYINKKKFQGNESAVCGRYGILWSTLHKMNIPFHQFFPFMEGGKKRFGSYDKFVLFLTT